MSELLNELGVIGAGNMAEAIVRGILNAGVLKASQIVASDLSQARRDLFSNQLKIATSEKPNVAAKVILLSVKPQQMSAVLGLIRSSAQPDTLFISIAAGVRSETIESALGGAIVVRAMPNTPMLVGTGMTAICRGSKATAEHLATARRLFECAGKVVEVDESQMEAVTAVSGSGPAYVFYLAEQMISSGVALGLSAEQAKTLALQTIAGAGQMLITSADEPAELRRKVTSPGGTTQAAIETLDELHVPMAIERAITAASERGKELGGR